MEFKRSKVVYISPLTLVTLSACGGSSDVSNVAAAISQTVSGNVVNGPLSNALVFLDLNSNGILDNSETSVRTDANGAFTISTTATAFQLIAITDDTTIDTSSGEVYSGVTLKAPSDASVITPTTTLMEEGDLSSEEVASVLGLPDGVDPLKFNPYADGVDADDSLAVAKLSNQLMTAVKSFAAAAEGAGAAELDAFEAALKSVVDVVKSKAAKLNDATATDADKVIDFTKTEDLDLIKAEAVTNAASKSGIDKAAFDALIDDTTTSIKNVNDQIKDVSDLTSDATKGVFTQSKELLDQVKAAAEAEKATPGSGSIDFSDTEKLKEKLAEEAEKAASNEAPTDIALNRSLDYGALYPWGLGNLYTLDSDQDDGFIYTIAEIEGTDYNAFIITYDKTETGKQVARLSFKEKPDLDASYTYKVTIVSTDKYGKQISKNFEILYLTNGDDEETLSSSPDLVIGSDGDDKIIGTKDTDYISGGDGDDHIIAGGGGIWQTYRHADYIDGGNGDDIIDASSASDNGWGATILPGLGNNNIIGSEDLWNALDGIDLNYWNVGDVGGITLTVGENGSGTVVSGDGKINDTFTFAHHFVGTSGDDVFYGSDTSDEPERKEFYLAYKGNDEIHGGGGHDVINFDLAAWHDGIEVDFAKGTATTVKAFTGIEDVRGSPGDDIITAEGYQLDVFVRGRDSNDIITGGTGDDTIYGDDGDDILNGGDGDDEIYAGAGNDTVYASFGSDYEDGGDGTDTFIIDEVLDYIPAIDLQKKAAYLYGGEPTQENLVNFENIEILSSSDFVLIGDGNANILKGGSGDDIIDGGDGNDTLKGGAGDDTLNGDAGDDVYYFAHQGTDTIVDSSGNDTIIVETKGSTGDYRFRQLYADAETYVLEGVRDNTSSKVTMSGVEIITWRSAEDLDADYSMTFGVNDETSDVTNQMYVGTLLDDNFATGQGAYVEGYGAAGDDTITVLGGSSWVTGDAGNDTLIGGAGNDTLKGDYTSGDAGNDTLYGNGGDDKLEGNDGNDTLDGGDGNDTLKGGAGDDTLKGGAGDDILEGGSGYDKLEGGDGDDHLVGGGGPEGVDYFTDWLDGGNGDDLLDASQGINSNWGSMVLPGLGNDTILGSEALWNNFDGIDIGYWNVSGVGGITLTVGENGSGTLVSGDGQINDTFKFAHYFLGTDGDDVFNGSDTSSDPRRIEGFVVNGGTSNEVHGNGGYDVINYEVLGYDGIVVDFVAGTGTNISSFTDIDEIHGSVGDDTITALGHTDDVWLIGAAGNDTMTGGSGNSFLSGEGGDDILNSGVGSDILIGGDGADSYIYQKGDGRDVIVGYREDEGDTLSIEGYTDEELAAATTTLVYGGWDDGQVRKELPDGGYIRIYTYDSTIVGDRDPEVLEGTTAADHIWGMDGNDTITGIDGNDYIGGGDGDDIIDGGLGADEISTGNGNDTVVIRQGDGGNTIVEADMISDFTDGSDLIGLHNLNYSDLTIEQGSGDYVNDALISSGSEYLVVIEDIDIADLTDEDFIAFDIV